MFFLVHGRPGEIGSMIRAIAREMSSVILMCQYITFVEKCTDVTRTLLRNIRHSVTLDLLSVVIQSIEQSSLQYKYSTYNFCLLYDNIIEYIK